MMVDTGAECGRRRRYRRRHFPRPATPHTTHLRPVARCFPNPYAVTRGIRLLLLLPLILLSQLTEGGARQYALPLPFPTGWHGPTVTTRTSQSCSLSVSLPSLPLVPHRHSRSPPFPTRPNRPNPAASYQEPACRTAKGRRPQTMVRAAGTEVEGSSVSAVMLNGLACLCRGGSRRGVGPAERRQQARGGGRDGAGPGG